MASYKCPVCERKFIAENFVKRHIEVFHKDYDPSPKLKGWTTPYGFVDFREPVTYAEAVETAKIFHSVIAREQQP